MAAEEAAVTTQEGLCLDLGVGADQEVGYQAVPVALAANCQTVFPPPFSGQLGCFRSQGLEDHSEGGERAVESGYFREVGTHLAPDDVAGHESTCIIGPAQRLSRRFAEVWIACQHIQED